MIDTDLPIGSMTMHRSRRPDVVAAMRDASLLNAGIEIRLNLQSDPEKKGRRRLCIWTDDPKYGRPDCSMTVRLRRDSLCLPVTPQPVPRDRPPREFRASGRTGGTVSGP